MPCSNHVVRMPVYWSRSDRSPVCGTHKPAVDIALSHSVKRRLHVGPSRSEWSPVCSSHRPSLDIAFLPHVKKNRRDEKSVRVCKVIFAQQRSHSGAAPNMTKSAIMGLMHTADLTQPGHAFTAFETRNPIVAVWVHFARACSID